MTARGQMCRPIDSLLTDGQWHGLSHPAAHPERARSTHRARVDAGRSAEGQMSPALRALGRYRCNRVASQPFSRANATGDASCEKEMRV